MLWFGLRWGNLFPQTPSSDNRLADCTSCSVFFLQAPPSLWSPGATRAPSRSSSASRFATGGAGRRRPRRSPGSQDAPYLYSQCTPTVRAVYAPHVHAVHSLYKSTFRVPHGPGYTPNLRRSRGLSGAFSWPFPNPLCLPRLWVSEFPRIVLRYRITAVIVPPHGESSFTILTQRVPRIPGFAPMDRGRSRLLRVACWTPYPVARTLDRKPPNGTDAQPADIRRNPSRHVRHVLQPLRFLRPKDRRLVTRRRPVRVSHSQPDLIRSRQPGSRNRSGTLRRVHVGRIRLHVRILPRNERQRRPLQPHENTHPMSTSRPYRYTRNQLEQLPTLAVGQADDLKLEVTHEGHRLRYWLARCGPEDGERYSVYVEAYENDSWVIADAY